MTLLIILVIIAVLIHYTFNWRGADLTHIYKNGTLFFGHRGLLHEAPENTIKSYQAAIDRGLRALELDIRLTKDNILVCSHNIDLERESLGSGFVDELSYKELSQIKTGRGFDEEEQLIIPTLNEVVKILPKDVLLNIEIKSDSTFDISTARELIKMIKKNEIDQPILVSSFNPLVVRYIKLKAKNIPTGYIYEHAKHFKGAFLARPDCLHPDAEFIDDKLLQFCQKRKMSINAWTVNNLPARNWLREKGVHGIITDNPIIIN